MITTRHEAFGEITYDSASDKFSAKLTSTARFSLSGPLGVGWIILGGCNLRCIHCYGNAEALPKGIIGREGALRVAQQLVDAGTMRVVLSGGEPLLYKHIFDIVRFLANSGVGVVLGTNGTYVTPKILPDLRKCVRVEVSLDGHEPSLHNRIRPSRAGRGNAFAEAIRAIEYCVGEGVEVRVLTAVNRHNQEYLEAIADQVIRLNVREWAVSHTLPAGRALPIFSNFSADPLTVAAAVERVRSTYSRLAVAYSNRVQSHDRYYCLVLPDGRVGTEDMSRGKKVTFASLIDAPDKTWWTRDHYDFRAHFDKWVGNRVDILGQVTPHKSMPQLAIAA
jgi:MoaA/NifB/PqqE/SkfB family radical SAM enzyme